MIRPRLSVNPSGAGVPELADERRQEDLHLAERERHPRAAPVAAIEREPLVRPELPLQEPLGPEPVGFGVELLAPVDQVRARAEDHPGGVLPPARRELCTVSRTRNGATGRSRRLSRISPPGYSSAGSCSASGTSPPVTRLGSSARRSTTSGRGTISPGA
jgi:hypothetical protein